MSWVPFSFIGLSRARGDYNRARVIQFRRTRRRFGCEGNPKELVHWSRCFTVVRKHGDHSLPREILAVTIFEGKPECHILPSFSWFGFELLCEVVEYVAVVFCTCLWLTWFDARQYTNLYWSSGRARMGSFYSWIWFGSRDWPLAWTRSSRHEKRPNRSKRSSRTKRAVQRRQTAFDPISAWARTDSIMWSTSPDRSNPTQKIKRKQKGSYSHIG